MSVGLRERLADGPPLLLDGPTGTELERRGIDTSGPLWSTRAVVDRPATVREVHADYAEAGADILTAVTFRGHPDAFERAGLGEDTWARTVGEAVRLARGAADDTGRRCWVAGSVAPVADCYQPALVPSGSVLRGEHGRLTALLAEAGADLLLVETMNTVREGTVAARAAQATGLPVFVSFVVAEGARLLSGEPLDVALEAVAPHADAVLVNCATLAAVGDAVSVLRSGGRPWGAYANGASRVPRPGDLPGHEVGVDAYGAAAERWRDAGARILGTCCGTGPAYTTALRALIDR